MFQTSRRRAHSGRYFVKLVYAFGLACGLSSAAIDASVASPAGRMATPPRTRTTAPTTRVDFSIYPAGTIVVRTGERKLYLVLDGGQTVSYPVAVGKAGKTWTGLTYVDRKLLSPAWSPPEEIKLDNPNIPEVIPAGAPDNPMGVAAMTLHGTEYAIHGTNNDQSIGRFASYGCIRMHNSDILDLYSRVNVGTPVVVLK